jgi:TetR/AcrR family transcriptional regulator, cholesterol catabolism regulator
MARRNPAQARNRGRAASGGGTTRRGGGSAGVRRRDQEVLDAAAQIFYERGYAEASVQDIADSLGMLKGSLYYYIDTKEDLLFRILEQVHDEVDAILDEILAMEETAPLERLRAYVRNLVLFTTGNLAKMSVYYHDIDSLSGERRETVLGRRRRHQEFVAELIQEAQGSGAATTSADPRLTRDFVFGAVIWIYRWYRPRGRYRREVIADECAEFVLHGVVGRQD